MTSCDAALKLIRLLFTNLLDFVNSYFSKMFAWKGNFLSDQ